MNLFLWVFTIYITMTFLGYNPVNKCNILDKMGIWKLQGFDDYDSDKEIDDENENEVCDKNENKNDLNKVERKRSMSF